MRMFACLTLFLSLGVTALEAQGTGKPFCPAGISNTEMEKHVLEGNLKKVGCAVTVDQLMEDTNARLAEIGSHVRFTNRAGLAEFIGGLQRVRCSEVVSGNFQMSRLLPSGLDNSGRWQRPCRPNEVLLCDGNLGICIYSEYCWNTVQSNVYLPSMPVARAPLGEPVAPVHLASPTIYVEHSGEVVHAHNGSIELLPPHERKSWFSRNWPWLVGGAAAVGGGIWATCEFTDLCRDKITIHNVNRNGFRLFSIGFE